MNDQNVLRPLVLVRGFGGADVSDDQTSPYQGFNDGTVYPTRRGENYIYEGYLLRALKSTTYPYHDATNVVGFYSDSVSAPPTATDIDSDSLEGHVVLDPGIESKVLSSGTAGTIWVYRYYDLRPRALKNYGKGLARLIELIERSAIRHGEEYRGVDIVAHSMGGLVTREGVLAMEADEKGSASRKVNRIVTLGTPHRGIAFQRAPAWLLRMLPKLNEASDELDSFDPESMRFLEWKEAFDMRKILTVVGTDFRSYNVGVASALNRLTNLFDEGNLVYNRSDGLVKQASAQLPGAPRTFVHKCHGGPDSLVTSRESYEISMRFFHGTHKVSLSLDEAKITRGGDWFGKSEFYFGVSIKPRYVDFELFHQSAAAQNCYGPFQEKDLSDQLPALEDELSQPLAAYHDGSMGWAGPDRLIWEGWVDAAVKPDDAQGLVFRADFYVGERDTYGLGFSDNVVFRKQYYIQVFPGEAPQIFIHTGERYLIGDDMLTVDQLQTRATVGSQSEIQGARIVPRSPSCWSFDIGGTGFSARLLVSIASDM
jgi:pimeloyl-ACP methyl ester carboxylesterase